MIYPDKAEYPMGGQHCKVVLRRREDGSAFASFHSQRGYGHPSLETHEVAEILRVMEQMEDGDDA